jgi:hypothetical protein
MNTKNISKMYLVIFMSYRLERPCSNDPLRREPADIDAMTMNLRPS